MTASPSFRKMADMISQDLVVVPLVESYMRSAKFPAVFDVTFRDEGKPREPDGYFHPSTHPLWPERLLYYYLTNPQGLVPEEFEYENRMALIMGSAVHSFVQTCMIDAQILLKPQGTCLACNRPHGTRKNDCEEFGALDKVLKRRGHMDGIIQIEHWGRGLFEFKCLAPETLVLMADGTQVRADKVSEGDWVVGWDEESQSLVPRVVEGAWDNGVVPVYTIRTREGREIGVTSEHPFLTQRGWVLAKNLVKGDKVRVAFDDHWATGDGDADEARFLGLIVGDGGITGRAVHITSADEQVTQWLQQWVATHGCAMHPLAQPITYRISAPLGSQQSQIIDLLRRENLMGKGSRSKMVPPSVWQGGPAVWAAFLSGYFDADGTVVTRGTYPHLSWASVNKELLLECQLLLGFLGIRSSVAEIRGSYLGEPHQSWRLLVRDAQSVTRAQEVLTPHSSKAERLGNLRPKAAKVGHHLTATPGWDSVVEVAEGEARSTVAMQVDGGTHVTNGLITHNTINPKACFGLDHHKIDWLKEKKPVYYAQLQEYLDMTGLQKAIILFCIIGFPWRLVEIEVPYDPAFAREIKGRYQRVRDAEQGGYLPDACCAIKSKESKVCPARAICPVGQVSIK